MRRERTEKEAFNDNRRLLRSYNRDLRTNEREALDNARSTQERRQIKKEADSLREEISPIDNERTRSKHTKTGRSPHVTPSAAVIRKEDDERIAVETNTDEVSSKDERIEKSSTIVIPDGESDNDILRWEGTDWVVLDAPVSSVDPLALTIEDGSMSWEETSVSGFTEETIDYVTSGNTASSKIFLTKDVPV